MTYIKWQDELESYLGALNPDEKEKVFAYFAEMYADKRDAGIDEKEIIEEFGAPYDVAKRILAENGDAGEGQQRPAGDTAYYGYGDNNAPTGNPQNTPYGSQNTAYGQPNGGPQNNAYGQGYTAPNGYNQNGYNQNGNPQNCYYNQGKQRGDYTWVFVLLCIIFAIPLFILLVTMAGITVGFCVAPIATVISGFAMIGGAIGGAVAGGSAAVGAAISGLGLITVGVGIILIPICFGLVKLMWKAFTKIFGALHKAFSGRG